MRLSDAISRGASLVGRQSAVHILQSVSGLTHEEIILHGCRELHPTAFAEYEQKIKRVLNGEPLQYVLGKWDFCGIEFIVDRRALIPRPETELLVEKVLCHIKDKQRLDILDVCTGSGCIGLSIAKLTGFRHNMVLADSSGEALSLAKENYLHITQHRECSGTTREGETCFQIGFFKADLLEGIPGEFDVIVSNPPYITSQDIKMLPENVKNFEPHLALDGGEDGLDIYRKLIPQSFEKLRPQGVLFLEIGPASAVEIMKKFGYSNTKIQKDYAGTDRILQGVKNHV